MPVAGASTSRTALSVSTSRIGSPFSTGSPSFLSQATICPVCWVISNLGINTAVGMLDLCPCQPASGSDNVFDLRDGCFFEPRVVWDGHVGAAEPHNGRLQVGKSRALRNHSGDLAAEAADERGLVPDQ